MEQPIRGVWEHVADKHIGLRVSSPSELERLETADGSVVGPVTHQVVGDKFSKYDATIDGLSVPVAYNCGHCDAIVVGQPDMRNPQEQQADDPIGATAYDIYCAQCDRLMYSGRHPPTVE